MKKLSNTIKATRNIQIKELAKIIVGETNSLINQHMSSIHEVFGKGKEKGIEFWHRLFAKLTLKKLLQRN